MKKASLLSLISFIDMADAPQEILDIREEMVNELARGQAKADANRKLYAEYHDKVIKALSVAKAPVTAQELATETGIARGKIVCGLTKYWTDEIGKDDSSKTATYYLKE